MNETSRSAPRAKSAFTLTEILVVIAIIAMLAAILFPVFAKARENSRRTSCQSNLKQLGFGLMMYSQDYDERTIPITRTGNLSDSPAISWTVALFPYTKNRAILRCPTNTSPVLGTNSVTGPSNTLNYSYNAYIGGQGCGTPLLPTTPGRLLSQISLPAQTPLLVEAVGIGYAAGSGTVDQSLAFIVSGAVKADPTYAVMQGRALTNPANLAYAPSWTGLLPVGYPTQADGFENSSNGIALGAPGANIHFDTANFLFADGHVKSLKTPVPVPPKGLLAPVPGANLDYCPDGIVGTATTYG